MTIASPPPSLTPIEAPAKVAELIARQLRERIASGELKAGDHLPSEAEMIEGFGVSRGSLREALRILEAESLVRVGRGNRKGPVVTEPNVARLSEYASIFLALRQGTVGDIHNARLLLEPSIVRGIAASAWADAAAADLDCCVDAIETASDKGELATAGAALEEFHRKLFVHARNVTLELVMLMLGGMLNESMILSMIDNRRRNAETLAAKLREIALDYRQVTALIRATDAAGAEAFWRAYMERSASFLAETGMAGNRVRYCRHD